MESAHLVLQGALKTIKDDGFDLNRMKGYDVASLLLDRLEERGFIVIKAPVKRDELPGSLPAFIGKNHIGLLACLIKSRNQYTDIANIRVAWRIPIDEAGDVEYLERLGYVARHPVMRDSARITDQGRKVYEQAKAYGYRREEHWNAMAG